MTSVLPPSPGNLTVERDLWQKAAYDLALKVADEGNLQTVRRLQLCEKSWAKLAGHFAILLSNRDTQQVRYCSTALIRLKLSLPSSLFFPPFSLLSLAARGPGVRSEMERGGGGGCGETGASGSGNKGEGEFYPDVPN